MLISIICSQAIAHGYWIISRDGIGFSNSLKVVVVDKRTGKIVSAIGDLVCHRCKQLSKG